MNIHFYLCKYKLFVLCLGKVHTSLNTARVQRKCIHLAYGRGGVLILYSSAS